MKNSFKLGALALVIAVSFAACDPKGTGSGSGDTTKVDTGKVDTSKVDTANKADTTQKLDTAAKK